MIIEEQPLPDSYKDHKLIGNYADRRECHIEPDCRKDCIIGGKK